MRGRGCSRTHPKLRERGAKSDLPAMGWQVARAWGLWFCQHCGTHSRRCGPGLTWSESGKVGRDECGRWEFWLSLLQDLLGPLASELLETTLDRGGGGFVLESLNDGSSGEVCTGQSLFCAWSYVWLTSDSLLFTAEVL